MDDWQEFAFMSHDQYIKEVGLAVEYIKAMLYYNK